MSNLSQQQAKAREKLKNLFFKEEIENGVPYQWSPSFGIEDLETILDQQIAEAVESAFEIIIDCSHPGEGEFSNGRHSEHMDIKERMEKYLAEKEGKV